MAGPAFIKREVFEKCLPQRYRDGDVATIYGDLARLAVGLAARTEPSELREIYLAAGWKPEPNVKAIHEAAKAWMATHRAADSKGA